MYAVKAACTCDCFLFVPGTVAYDKLHTLLTYTRVVNDVKRLSPDAQTSCLEGFHATLNHWHPKMLAFSWLGTYCRYECMYMEEV